MNTHKEKITKTYNSDDIIVIFIISYVLMNYLFLSLPLKFRSFASLHGFLLILLAQRLSFSPPIIDQLLLWRQNRLLIKEPCPNQLHIYQLSSLNSKFSAFLVLTLLSMGNFLSILNKMLKFLLICFKSCALMFFMLAFWFFYYYLQLFEELLLLPLKAHYVVTSSIIYVPSLEL